MSGLGSIIFTFVVVSAVYTYAAVTQKPTTTHMPTTTREINEYEAYFFYYNPSSHRFYVKIDVTINKRRHRTCWIAQLSNPEQEAVHNPFGMRVLEVKTLAKLSTGVETPLTNVTTIDKRLCGTPRNGTLSVFMLPV